MKKGFLHEKKFNLNSPHLQKDMDAFSLEVGERMKEHGIKQFVAAKKQEGDILHVVVLPCSDSPAQQAQIQEQLKELGGNFEVAQVSSTDGLKNYASTDIEPVSLNFNFNKP